VVYSMTMMWHIMVIEYTTPGYLVVWGHVVVPQPSLQFPCNLIRILSPTTLPTTLPHRWGRGTHTQPNPCFCP
jgi:hypothetical protein